MPKPEPTEDATVSIVLADGTSSGEIPLSRLKEALRLHREDRRGHNSGVHEIAREQLRSFIERIERLDEEVKAINQDKAEVYGEAKSTGFDTKIIKKVIAIRRQDKDQRAEEEAILETYLAALGMIEGPADEA